MNLMETIHLHKNDFSKTERKVYDYIVQNPTAIETATITKIAELCQVSTSGIFTFFAFSSAFLTDFSNGP